MASSLQFSSCRMWRRATSSCSSFSLPLRRITPTLPSRAASPFALGMMWRRCSWAIWARWKRWRTCNAGAGRLVVAGGSHRRPSAGVLFGRDSHPVLVFRGWTIRPLPARRCSPTSCGRSPPKRMLNGSWGQSVSSRPTITGLRAPRCQRDSSSPWRSPLSRRRTPTASQRRKRAPRPPKAPPMAGPEGRLWARSAPQS